MPKTQRSLLAPVLLLGAFVVGMLLHRHLLSLAGVADDSSAARILGNVLKVGVGLSVAWGVIRALDVFVWQRRARILGRPVPRLLKDILAVLIFTIAVAGLAVFVFGQPIVGVWATSSVVGIVCGFALRNIILDVFTGLAINLDQSIRIGDWVEIHHNSFKKTVYGKVIEINWRTLRVDLGNGRVVVVPNSLMAVIPFTNYSQPDDVARFEVLITLDFSVSTERATRILLAAVRAVSGKEGPVEEPAPKVRVDEVTDSGIRYKVRYYVHVNDVSPGNGRHIVTRSILEHLTRAGLTPSYPKRDTFQAPMPPRGLDTQVEADRVALLARIDLFQNSLRTEELEALAKAMRPRRFRAGEVLIHQGDVGESMFVLAEGMAYVYLDHGPDNGRVRVGQLTPGQVIGEMSLLTGEPRTATVTAATDVVAFEVGKEHVQELLLGRPGIAEEISNVVAERRVQLREAAATAPPEERLAEKQHLGRQILEKMKQIFRWGTGDSV
jgi:small-conductance mechanosensitive channel/CRP-like cAMP-binding protein